MSSCFGSRKKSKYGDDTEPLLPVYEDDTALQRRVHQKLHTYQMFRALSKGFMPSNEQVIINLRTLIASDVLNADTTGLSNSGRRILQLSKKWITEFIELLKTKNEEDQIQDFIWFLIHARISVDTEDLIQTATSTKAKADASAAFESVKTVGSLLLTNSDFRVFLQDLNTIGRQVFADTAKTVSSVADEAAQQIEPSTEESDIVKNGNDGEPITTEDLQAEASELTDIVANGVKKTGQEAVESLKENVTGGQKETLLKRLKAAVTNLRGRADYSDGVDTIGLLIQRYAKVYSRAVDDTISTVQDDVDANPALDRAVKNGWLLVSAFGDKEAWKELEKRTNKVMSHAQKDPEFENLMGQVAESITKLLSDPSFYDEIGKDPNGTINELSEKAKEAGSESPLKQDIDALLKQARITFHSVINDREVHNLLDTTLKLWTILTPTNQKSNTELITDTTTVLLPLVLSAIQYIPIPRLEVSNPDADLLLENLILEPGRNINNSSFLPYQLLIKTANNISVTKRRFRTVSAMSTLCTITIKGISLRATDIGYFLRTHKSFLKFTSSGLASFELDERGVDVELQVLINHSSLENVLSLKAAKVKIHHLNYQLRKTVSSWFFFLLKPFLRPILTKVLEVQMGKAIEDFIHAANREIVFARERLRATRISDPKDIQTFFKAVLARLTPEEDPDVYVNVGVRGGAEERGGVFAGVYAPGSVVKLWDEEAAMGGAIVEDNAAQGWRNDIFDVTGRAV